PTGILRNAQLRAPRFDIAAVRTRGKMRLTARRAPRPGTADEPEHKTEGGDGGDREQPPDRTRQATARRRPRFAPMTQKRTIPAVTHRSRACSEHCEASPPVFLSLC